ncbi:rare lipoprotein A [Legionella geestiana]|uniref:Endolytic peptidoglycan transglycosylase RlpA n=1 Tax=Legionella geestiana TaxID=45065 RepID=A0A0W0U9A2_9GAMM|nr:septal ring lytic transglycosylase RlpA family protein [Legionella geestiana]KTD04220.1 rare lipoprotein A [Legionella geestiana]QBS11642.1 septal ring lytic transglycosylase RlpA family protein [Legionella geestiana]QDQ40748.1 septal ring lytic transglycosylase RlpA family protein [Legionella geestiana]STX53675.1 Lipoprotein [Legionella geestiana]
MRRCALLIPVVFLAACKTAEPPAPDLSKAHPYHPPRTWSGPPTEKDSAPKGPVPTSFKEVKPRDEPVSRYGNPASYRVDGRTYEVMTSSGGYKTRGIASWYGTKFHSKRTSSGEPYDMYALTAAHKTLPLPTYVRVKNLNNGLEAIIKVNDRGPFHADRVMDLSYGAAVKLGLFPAGTAPVEIEALNVAGPGKAREAHYYLQAGAFETERYAEALREKLGSLTPSPVFVEKYDSRYIVRVGPFANRQMSEALKSRLAMNGINGAFSMLQ